MLWLVTTLILVTLTNAIPSRDLHPDTGLNVIELIEKYNYPLEIHTIQTEDGYLLEMHRIPHGLTNANETNKRPIFLLHGSLCSSGVWVTMGPGKGLAFLLADWGYDVWIGNSRGNMWSRKHISLDPDVDKEEFWSFSWHELGVYDNPACIDYILSKTNQEKLFYVGHSQGTAAFFVMASEKPEYNDKIRLAVAMGPAAYVYHVENPFLRLLSQYVDAIDIIAEYLGIYEFFPSVELMDELAELCRATSESGEFCDNIFFLIFGWDSTQIAEWMIPVIVTHVPAGGSIKELVHFGQLVNSGKFRQYDYGLVGNLNHYGSVTPPDYDLSKVVAPVALFVGENDTFTTVADVELLAAELPTLALKYFVPYNHMDFLYAEDVRDTLYSVVYTIMMIF